MQCEAKKQVLNLLCGVLVMNGILCASQQDETNETRLLIWLRPVVEVTRADVRLADIAIFVRNEEMCTLNDLSEEWQRQLRRVDVVRLSNQRPAAMVTRQSVNIRLQVLGSTGDQFEIIGPDVVLVSMAKPEYSANSRIPMHLASRSEMLGGSEFEANFKQQPDVTELTDLSIERAIRDELTSQFGIATDGLQVRLLRSMISADSTILKDVVNPIIEVTAPVKMPYGRQSLVVRILDDQRIAMMQSVTVDVRLRQNLLMARRPISAGTKLDASMLTEEVRFTDRQYDQLSAEDVMGMVAIRPLRSMEIVAWNNLRDTSSIPAALAKPIVNARDAVRVVASHKTIRIAVSAAQALESGRKGQLIRVRNIQSGKVFSARVIQSGEVQLIL